MGQAVGVHPLVVIFAVLAGANIYGIAGMLLALPLVALVRELYAFFKPRISLEKWQEGTAMSAAEKSSIPIEDDITK